MLDNQIGMLLLHFNKQYWKKEMEIELEPSLIVKVCGW